VIHKTPPNYEKKFAEFIRLCDEAKAKGINTIVINFPWVLGDNYEEIIESLSRAADAGLALHIAARKDWPSQN
jgi:DNA repair photolyase